MGLFFGTDGIRGKVNDDLPESVIYKCGNSLGGKNPGARILIGRDTRRTGSFVAMAFAVGAMNAGVSVVDVGVCPTAGISYLTRTLGFDFGVVISASHSEAEYNGIKIFDRFGKKLSDAEESEIEKGFLKEYNVSHDRIGVYEHNPRLVIKYESFLAKSISSSLKGKTIVLDCANGAAFKLAPAVFRDNKAKIIATYCKPDGLNINKNCGALHIEKLQKYVLKYKADMGFAFDGDSDRLIAVDETGKVISGDELLYVFAVDYLEKGKLKGNTVVGTRHTNIGVEKALEQKGVELVRTNIGDKYVRLAMSDRDLMVGGEQSGHIILADKQATGDGILNALCLAEICVKKNKKLSELASVELFKQCNLNIPVRDKIQVVNSEKLSKAIELSEQELLGKGRVMVHISGTEQVIRVMVESGDELLSKRIASNLAGVVENINEEI